MSYFSSYARNRGAMPAADTSGRFQWRVAWKLLPLAVLLVALHVTGCTDSPAPAPAPTPTPGPAAQGENAVEPADVHHAVTVTDATFQAEVLDNDQVVLVDVWAAWCGPCVRLAPTIEEIAGEYEGRVTVAKVNSDENPNIGSQYEVTALPTLLFFQNGKVVDKVVGLASKQALTAKLDALLAASE